MILHQPTLTFLSEQRWRVVWIRKDQIKKAKFSQEEVKCLTKPDLDQIQMKRNKTTELNVFPENPVFSNSAFARSSFGLLFKLMKRKYWPLVLWTIHIYISIGAHSSSERSQTIRGHFLNFYRGLMQKSWAGFHHLERWYAQLCMHSLSRKIYPPQLWRCTQNVGRFIK